MDKLTDEEMLYSWKDDDEDYPEDEKYEELKDKLLYEEYESN